MEHREVARKTIHIHRDDEFLLFMTFCSQMALIFALEKFGLEISPREASRAVKLRPVSEDREKNYSNRDDSYEEDYQAIVINIGEYADILNHPSHPEALGNFCGYFDEALGSYSKTKSYIELEDDFEAYVMLDRPWR